MLELATIAAALLNQICEVPDVIDVTSGNRFGEQVIVVSIPTSAEHDRVTSLLPANWDGDRFYVMPVFGLGSFTGDSKETKEVLSLAYISPYNIYGTPEQKKLEKLMDDIFAREAEVWAAMTPEDRRAAVDKDVNRKRSEGDPDFGNCWSR